MRHAAQDLVGLPGRVTSISVKLDGIRQNDKAFADRVKADIIRAIRNETPILNLDAGTRSGQLTCTKGTMAVEEQDGVRQLTVTPEGEGQRAVGEVMISDVAAVLERADEPTTLVLEAYTDVPSDSKMRPWFELVLVDSEGRRYHAGSGFRRHDVQAATTSGNEVVPVKFELANFLSQDRLDLLDPADIDHIILRTYAAPVVFSGIRFEDDRRVMVNTWWDKQAPLLQAVNIERYIQVIIMTLMVVIAGFSILAILWLMVKEKTRDIGILMSLGATRIGIVSIFLLNGLMIGITGSVLGLALGWTMSANLNWIEDKIFEWTGWQAFPPSIYYLDRLPHVEDPGKFTVMALFACAVSLAAALWPAIKASRLDPIEALRYE